MAPPRFSLEHALESKIERIPFSTCWWHIGNWDKDGYSKVTYGGKIVERAHRAAYRLWKGNPDGFIVCHTCDNPCCVNPDHLFLGTNKDNAEDRVKKGRSFHPKKELHPMRKLTNEQVEEIRSLKGKLYQRQIGEMFGVGQSHVSAILKGEYWK